MNLENVIDNWLAEKAITKMSKVANFLDEEVIYCYRDLWILVLKSDSTIASRMATKQVPHISDPDFFKKLESAITSEMAIVDSYLGDSPACEVKLAT